VSRHVPERHRSDRSPWLRAAVLGANDGIVSIAALLVGVASADPSPSGVLLAGVAGLVSGALSMAAGEYVSVATQRDAELADAKVEAREQKLHPEYERQELTDIYVARGLTPELARQVADQLHARDPLRAHLRDELGLDVDNLARPVQAALTSAASFASGAAIPVAVAVLAPASALWAVPLAATIGLAVTGVLGARAGGASPWVPAARVVLGGLAAMGLSAAVGALVGIAV